MGRNTGLVLTFFFSGLLLSGLGFLVSKWVDYDSPSGPVLARAEILSADVFILKKHLTQRVKLNKKTSVQSLETIETGPDGEVALDFPSEYRLTVLPNAQVTLDQEGEKTLVIVKAGEIRVDQFGREGSLFISRGGHRWSATEYGGRPKADPNDPKTLANKEISTEGLSPTYILETLKAQKGTFYKCYTQLLQRLPGISGEASISITIEPNGKISRSEIASSKLEDNNFRKCLMEATSRIEFKSFIGEAVTTVFPVLFE